MFVISGSVTRSEFINSHKNSHYANMKGKCTSPSVLRLLSMEIALMFEFDKCSHPNSLALSQRANKSILTEVDGIYYHFKTSTMPKILIRPYLAWNL